MQSRKKINDIIAGNDKRMLAIVGPCSIHNTHLGLEYAEGLAKLIPSLSDVLFVVMRCYFEKPRTRLGWPGMIMDPNINESYDVEQGLYGARDFLAHVSRLNIPCGTEFLDPIVPQYIDDYISWASIGARTTESQIHRYMASGLSMPVGFKNSTQGNIMPAINAMGACRYPHSFLGINQKGQTSVLHTKGHEHLHLILRGGSSGPNYTAEHVADARACLQETALPESIVIDCSHDNSYKDITQQSKVLRNIIEQRISGTENIVGFMLESNLHEGKHTDSDIALVNSTLSITDPCIGWEETAHLLQETAERLRKSTAHTATQVGSTTQ